MQIPRAFNASAIARTVEMTLACTPVTTGNPLAATGVSGWSLACQAVQERDDLLDRARVHADQPLAQPIFDTLGIIIFFINDLW
jgi:hypothetical protein